MSLNYDPKTWPKLLVLNSFYVMNPVILEWSCWAQPWLYTGVHENCHIPASKCSHSTPAEACNLWIVDSLVVSWLPSQSAACWSCCDVNVSPREGHYTAERHLLQYLCQRQWCARPCGSVQCTCQRCLCTWKECGECVLLDKVVPFHGFCLAFQNNNKDFIKENIFCRIT